MTEPAGIIADLKVHKAELDKISNALMEVERRLVEAEAMYEDEIGEFEEKLWKRHVQHGEKFPPEAVRTRLAHREMDPDFLGKYLALQAQRRRMMERISSLKKVVEAERSILSAEKEGLV